MLLAGQPALVLGQVVVPWTTSGYARARARPEDGTVEVITPPSSVAAIRAGYQPKVDASAWPGDDPAAVPRVAAPR